MANPPSFANSKVLRQFNLNNVSLDGAGFFRLPLADVSEFGSFYMVCYNSNANLDITLEYSTNAILQTSTSFTEVVNTTGSLSFQDLGTYKVKTRFLGVTFSGSPGQSITFQLVFRKSPPSESIALNNVGGGAQIHVNTTDGDLRTIQSSDASVTVTQNASDIDLTVAGAISTIWTETGGEIKPITAVTNGLLCGDTSGGASTNDFTGTNITSVICGGDTNTMNDTLRCGMIGGGINSITAISAAFPACDNAMVGGMNNSMAVTDRSVVIGGQNHTVTGSAGNLADSCFIIGGENSAIPGNQNCGIIGGNGNTMTTGGANFLLDCTIIGGETNTIIGGGGGAGSTNNCGIFSSENCSIEKFTETVILGGLNHTFTQAATGFKRGNFALGGNTNNAVSTNLDNSGFVGGANNALTDCADNNVIVGGEFNTINGVTTSRSVMLGGRNGTISNPDCLMFTSGITSLASTTAQECSFKFPGGYRFFSNDAATTGVTLAAGANSWAAVCDENVKENKMECNYSDVMTKMESVKIHCYNYIGNPVQQKCYGPMAQNWHSVFSCDDIPVLDEETGEQLLDGQGMPIFKEAKNKLVIEFGDMMGVALACIKNLNARVKDLESRIAVLESA